MLSSAIAQQTPTATSNPLAQPQSNWATQCNSASRDQPLSCSLEQRIVLRETGQQLARIEIRVGSEEPRQPALLVHVPLGLSIRAGIKLQVDDAEPLVLDIQTCDASGCYAGNPVGPELLASLKKGNSVKIVFQNLQQKEISVGFSLDQFIADYSKIE